nr:DUF3558 family protein [Kibdelosporangium sp. MJ126-NF4]
MGLYACTTETPGLPTSGGLPTSAGRPTVPGGGGTSGVRPTSPSATAGDNPVRDIDACALLTSAERATLAVGSGSVKDGQTDVDKGCLWDSTDQGKYLVQVNVYGNLGHKDVNSTGGVKSIPNVGKHKAVQYVYGPVCVVSLAITDSSRVDATGNTGSDVDKACQVAKQVAQMIESKLPGGS